MAQDDSNIGAPTKTTPITGGIWYNAETDSIHLALSDAEGVITTVNRKQGSKRCHENLFMKLARCLKQDGKPFPACLDDPLDAQLKDS